MDLLYILASIVLFLALTATFDLVPTGGVAARDAMREAFQRGEIDEERYAAGLRALSEAAV
ncbi:MAG: hypothetical protein FJ028_04415 [Chloroflexi bacterium]|nr:hypothetical protein [Chloroflexota bacterium]